VAGVSTLRIVISAAVGLLALSAAVFGLSELMQRTSSARALVARPVTHLVVTADTGDVTVRAGLTSNVIIDRKDSWLLSRPTVKEEVRGSTLYVEASCGGLRGVGRCRSDLLLDAPPEIDVRVNTRAGNVDLRGLSGRVQIKTRSGDIATHRLAPITLVADTDAGDVTLDLFGAPARTEARSRAGNVRVIVPFGPYRVDATTHAGNVKVEGIIRDDLAPQAIDALTGAGNITVRAR
jgi:hypothetical protein